MELILMGEEMALKRGLKSCQAHDAYPDLVRIAFTYPAPIN